MCVSCHGGAPKGGDPTQKKWGPEGWGSEGWGPKERGAGVAPTFVWRVVSKPHCVVKSGRVSLANFSCEAFAFSRHNINLELDEEIMQPEKATKAPKNNGLDPKHDRVNQKAPTGTNRASHEAREPIQYDKERLANKHSHVFPPTSCASVNSRNQVRTSNATWKRCTVPATCEDANT